MEKLEFVIVYSEKIRGLVVSLDNRHFYMATSCAKSWNAVVIMKNAEVVMAEAKA